MRKRAKKSKRMQGGSSHRTQAAQMLLPMVAGMVATRQELEAWVHQQGLKALDELFRVEAEQIAGPKGKHSENRSHNHWGQAEVELPFGGRRVTVMRPRVRSKPGGEVQLPSVEHFRTVDPMAERVVEQILLGVSTRGYGPSLGPPPPAKTRGTSKSAASRHLVARTKQKMAEQLSRPLGDLDVVVLFLDGIIVAKRTIVVALGVVADGSKVPLGLWQGSTENAATSTALLQDLIGRGLRIERRMLCVIDGGKGLRKALDDVLGDRAVVQRCQVHKRRNVREHLPKERQSYVDQMMREAYTSGTAKTARKRLRSLLSWLERNGEDGAAGSLREGLEETLTVLKLDLKPSLRRSLSTTNSIENMLGTVRRVTRNVKRWRDSSDMVRRWTALGVFTAERRFRRIKGFRDMPSLIRTLEEKSLNLDAQQEAA
jgi:transposase-like protein